MHGSEFESSRSADSHTNFMLKRKKSTVEAPKDARFYCHLWKQEVYYTTELADSIPSTCSQCASEATEWHRARWLSSAGKGRKKRWKRDAERHFPAKSSQSRARGRAMPPIARRDRARIESPLRKLNNLTVAQVVIVK